MCELIRCPECGCATEYKGTTIDDILETEHGDEYRYTCKYIKDDEYKLSILCDEYKLYLNIKDGKYQYCRNCYRIISTNDPEIIDCAIIGCGLNKREFTLCAECKHENDRVNCCRIRSAGGWATATSYDVYWYNCGYGREDYHEDEQIDF